MEHVPIDSGFVADTAPHTEITLTEKRLDVLGCLACKTSQGETFTPDAIRSIQQCTGLLKGTVREIMNTYVNHGYAEVRARVSSSPVGTKRPSTNEHTITEAGTALLREGWEPCKEEIEAQQNPYRGATPMQRSFLRCISCLVSQGKEPRTGDIASCNQRSPTQINTTLKRFVEVGALQKIDASVKHRGKGWQNPKQFTPTEKGSKFLPAPPERASCLVSDIEPIDSYAMLASAQQSLLSTLDRLAKAAEGNTIPQHLLGSESGIHAGTAKSALQRLEELGYLTRQNVGGQGSHARYTVTITEKGQATIDAFIRHQQKIERVKACISCALTKQALKGEQTSIGLSVIAQCQKVSEALVASCVNHAPGVAVSEVSHNGFAQQRLELRGAPDLAAVDTTCLAPTREKELEYFTPLPENAFSVSSVFDKERAPADASWLKAVRHHRILSHEEELELGTIIQDPQSSAEEKYTATSMLVSHNIRLALKATHEVPFARAFLTFDDRLQAALIGINHAARGFDPTKNFKFSTYAFMAAKNNIMREAAGVADVPEHLFWLLPPLQYHLHEYKRQTGRHPNAAELALFADIPIRRVVNAQMACRPHVNKVLLDKPITSPAIKKEGTLHDIISDTTTDNVLSVLPEAAMRLLGDLKGHEQAILASSLGVLDLSHDEIASHYDVPRTTVTKAAKRVRSLMRHPYYGLASSIPRFEWQTQASCFVKGFKAVVRPRTGASSRQEYNICNDCPVQQQCYDLATAGQETVTSGVWGGHIPSHFKK